VTTRCTSASCDAAAFDRHLDQVRRHFVGTRSPRLFQRAERLAVERRAFGPLSLPEAASGTEAETVLQVTAPLRAR
jgi:hypothetical protein